MKKFFIRWLGWVILFSILPAVIGVVEHLLKGNTGIIAKNNFWDGFLFTVIAESVIGAVGFIIWAALRLTKYGEIEQT